MPLHSTASVAPVQPTSKTSGPLWSIPQVGQTSVRPVAVMFVPQTRTQLGRRSLHVAAPTLCNSFPLHLCSPSVSRGQLRSALKTHLVNEAYTSLWERFALTVNLLTYLLTYILNKLSATLRQTRALRYVMPYNSRPCMQPTAHLSLWPGPASQPRRRPRRRCRCPSDSVWPCVQLIAVMQSCSAYNSVSLARQS